MSIGRLVGARWVDADNFAKGPAHFFDGAPEHMREKLREDAQFRVAENYLLSGLGRHASRRRRRSRCPLAVFVVGAAWRQAVSDGDAPCGTDATAFGALAGILTPYFTSPLRERAEKFENLTAYVDRIMGRYYPDFAWDPLQEAA